MPHNRTDRTIDGVPITDGLIVWDYNLDLSVVSTTDHFESHGVRWYQCFNPVTGQRRSDFDGSRMWARHPSTGVPASEVNRAPRVR